MKRTYQLIEDNGGSITVAVFDGDEVVYLASGFEGNSSEEMADAIHDLDMGESIDSWDGCIDVANAGFETLTEAYEKWFTPEAMRNGGWSIVADQDGIYPANMGNAAKTLFKIK
jgi:hypothetical protein